MRSFSLIIIILLAFNFALSSDLNLNDLSEQYKKHVLAPEDLRSLKHDFLVTQLQQIAEKNSKIQMIQVGSSVEGRSINMLSFGSGKTKLLLWSQMHGDEPTATAGLLAIFNYLAENSDLPFVENLYNNISINAIIMLNPDGAERFQRRNVQDIDINRDARLLQSPEARTLKAVKDSINPDFGYNLHNMTGREMVGDSRKLLNIAFMAPPFNFDDQDTPTRIRAKQLVVYMKDVLDNFIEGHISIYKADYMPRAFGDAMQNWGVSTVLIESALHDHDQADFLVQMNFIALLASFDAIADNKIAGIDAKRYDNIPIEGRSMFDLMIRNVLIYNGDDIPAFRGDIGINILNRSTNDSLIERGQISDIGDLSIITGGRIEIDGSDLAVMPGLIAFDDSLKPQDLYARGITLVSGSEVPSQHKPLIPPKSFDLDHRQISNFTLRRAMYLNQNTGWIKRGKDADLVVFQLDESGMFKAENIRYVIKNGQIVYKK
jgi:hypothetical protein